jgi:SpoVK/Ycf46/Vps4 family AAA+-type ATPase
VRLELVPPEAAWRAQLWKAALDGRAKTAPDVDLSILANRFQLTGGQIRDAAVTANNFALWHGAEPRSLSMADLYEACRLHSNQKLDALARKIHPKYRWDDIVLPADRVDQLRELCNHVKYRERVYGDWGFGRKLAYCTGLSVLFSGPSGTGKTMAADIIAGELGLDLYKIDLSTVVSKYIGDTEKNLSQIFDEAESSNAVLFFDEADALFGKRSEVKDSHDRYANIETGYLLQRMEEYSGVAILASNFKRNMDEAFVRRLHFAVEFPFPNVQERRRIWEGVWPDQTPLAADLDFEVMANRFEVSGGNIRNVALAATFLAAESDGSIVRMSHLMRAIQREYQKMGKVLTEVDLGTFADSRFVALRDCR